MLLRMFFAAFPMRARVNFDYRFFENESQAAEVQY